MSASAAPSRHASVRARIDSIRGLYCCQGPCLPHRPAILASFAEKDRTMTCPVSPRIRVAVATMSSPSPVTTQSMECPARCISAGRASPQTEARPLMTAMFDRACIGARPISMPRTIAAMIMSGLSWKCFGTMSPARASACAIRKASSMFCGASAARTPPTCTGGFGLAVATAVCSVMGTFLPKP